MNDDEDMIDSFVLNAISGGFDVRCVCVEVIESNLY